tara:strand:- start:54 stop:743 length:690 start_codon:yes stop_codon:yes gene_type:complete
VDFTVNCPFGPLIYTADISGDFHKFLVDGLEDCRKAQDARQRLVGNIDQQRFAPYNPQKFTKFLDPHIVNYMEEKNNRHNNIKDICNDKLVQWDAKKSTIKYNLGQGPWVNFQKKGEFNPIHNHGGIVSAVIFIKIPKELKDERDSSTYTAKASGCLEFLYMGQHIVVKPKEAMMFLFPAYLQHAVYPYHSDVERVSMSFNFDEIVIDDFPVPGNDDIIFYGKDPTEDL